MTRFKKLIAASAVLLLVGYISKPDRGGVGRCSRIFDIPELDQFHLAHRPFYGWELFESPKFRFTISRSDISRLGELLKAAGYSEWKKGGVTFGSVSHGWTPEEDYVYCRSSRRGYNHYWSYSAKENLIYAITSPN